MADTVVSGAAVHPHDEGYPNISDGSEDWNSAGLQGLIGMGAHGKFLHGWTGFSGHDATNDQVDVEAFVAVLDLDEAGASVDVQSTLGGTSAPAYDTTLAAPGRLAVAVPKQSNLGVTSATLNPVWVAYATDGTVTNVSAGDVYLRHGSGESAPPSAHPSIKLGETNPDDSTADFRAGFDNPPDAHGWRRDPNSPLEQSATGSDITYTLAGRYDEVRVEVTSWTDRAQDHGYGLRINGDSTANYQAWKDGGSKTYSDADQWGDVVSSQASGQDVDGTMAIHTGWTMDGRWLSGDPMPSISIDRPGVQNTGGGINVWASGHHNGSISPPLTDFTLVLTNNTGAHIRVFGRNDSSRPNL